MNGYFLFLKYTETGNVLETIRRFRKQFPNQRTPYGQTIMDNYNKCVQYGLSVKSWKSAVVDVSVSKLPLKPDCFQNITGFCILLNHFSIHSPTENSCLGCAPAIFVQFCCFLPLHSSILFLGFTYCKALEHLRNTWLCNTCDHPFV